MGLRRATAGIGEVVSALTVEDRAYVLDRLDRAHIAEVAGNVRAHLDRQAVVEACYQPGDATWYSLLFVPLAAVVSGEGGGTAGYGPQSFYAPGGLLVSYGQRGTCAEIIVGGCDPDFAAEKLSPNPASALAIAELLRAVLEP